MIHLLFSCFGAFPLAHNTLGFELSFSFFGPEMLLLSHLLHMLKQWMWRVKTLFVVTAILVHLILFGSIGLINGGKNRSFGIRHKIITAMWQLFKWKSENSEIQCDLLFQKKQKRIEKLIKMTFPSHFLYRSVSYVPLKNQVNFSEWNRFNLKCIIQWERERVSECDELCVCAHIRIRRFNYTNIWFLLQHCVAKHTKHPPI